MAAPCRIPSSPAELTDARLDRLAEIFLAASRGAWTHPASVDFVLEHINPALAELRARRAAEARVGAGVLPIGRAS